MYKRQIHISTLLLTASLLLFSMASQVTASNQSNSYLNEADVSQWIAYEDARFSFSLEYPADWYVMPRDDSDPEAMSGVLMFTPVNPNTTLSTDEYHDSHKADPYIAIGLYLAELEPGQPLTEWTELYQEASKSFDDEEIQNTPLETLRINQSDAVQQKGISPITEYKFTNISHGYTVWFIWTNISDSDSLYSSIYNHMVNSFRFGKDSPTRLSDIYGSDFQPLRLGEESPTNINNQTNRFWHSTETKESKGLQILALGSNWKSPVVGWYNVQCGSPWHTGKAEFAADVGTPMNTSVYTAYSGNVFFAGWNNDGYGNLIKTSSVDGKIAYYAHLNTINTYNGANIVTYQFIAKSGNSGPSSIHLHFHVNYTNLTGMSGFFPNANYPTMQDVSCGNMGS